MDGFWAGLRPGLLGCHRPVVWCRAALCWAPFPSIVGGARRASLRAPQARASCLTIIVICSFLPGLREWVGRALGWALPLSSTLPSYLKGLLASFPKCQWDGWGWGFPPTEGKNNVIAVCVRPDYCLPPSLWSPEIQSLALCSCSLLDSECGGHQIWWPGQWSGHRNDR